MVGRVVSAETKALAKAMFAAREESLRRLYPESAIEGWSSLSPTERSLWTVAAEVLADDHLGVWQEAQAERDRAHAKHGDKSMESWAPNDYARLAILMEEIGEVAREFNEAELRSGDIDLTALRAELIQVTAMAGAWADSIGGPS